MERSNELCPSSWLEPLISADVYGHNDTCEAHNQYCIRFCKNCTTKPFCELCWKDAIEAEHEGHQTLRIYIVSRKASIRIADIEREVDVTDIQPYRANGHTVILLKQKERNGGAPKCVICQGKIKNEEYQFCSISCKIMGLKLGLCKREENEAECSTRSYSLRTKPRKRTPVRSHLK